MRGWGRWGGQACRTRVQGPRVRGQVSSGSLIHCSLEDDTNFSHQTSLGATGSGKVAYSSQCAKVCSILKWKILHSGKPLHPSEVGIPGDIRSLGSRRKFQISE